MTRDQFLSRLKRVKGLTILDPWGTRARVWSVEGDYLWLSYDGLDIPFRRSIEGCLQAANGVFALDRSRQFVKRVVVADGVGIELEFEPGYEPGRVASQAPAIAPPKAPQPTLESLRALRLKAGNPRKS